MEGGDIMRLTYTYNSFDGIKVIDIDFGDMNMSDEDFFNIVVSKTKESIEKDASSSFTDIKSQEKITIKSKNIISIECKEINKKYIF